MRYPQLDGHTRFAAKRGSSTGVLFPAWHRWRVVGRVCLVIAAGVAVTCSGRQAYAQTTSTSRPSDANAASPKEDLPLSAFRPKAILKARATDLQEAKFTVVDAHSHFWIRLRHDPDQLKEFVALMDRNRIGVCVSLDGRLGNQLEEHIRFLWDEHEDRFAIFANINWQGDGVRDKPETWACHQPGFARSTVFELEQAKKRGISGVKVFKSFGLRLRNPDGTLVAIDDERFAAIWDACGRLNLPVIIHTADPSAFFQPLTPENERYEELSRHPDWHFPSEKFPSRQELHAARNRMFARHANTQFIAAHLGNDGEDLEETAALLDAHPNVVVEIASRIAELGRQPFSAREFLIRYQDRILFGTDGPWPEQRYRYYWRFLETDDEYFPYSEKAFPPQGFWRIYGTYLPDSVLQKIYHANAARIIPGVAERLQNLKGRLAPLSTD